MSKQFDVLLISVMGSCSGESCINGMKCSTTGLFGVEENFERVRSGGWIVDLRPVEDPVMKVIKAPMLGLNLKPNEVDSLSREALDKSIVAQAVKDQPGNPLGAIVRIEEACREQGFSSLDTVGIDLWLQYWRKNGARIGRVGDDGGVTWEGEGT